MNSARERVACCSLIVLMVASGGCESREAALPGVAIENEEPAVVPQSAEALPAVTPLLEADSPLTGRAADAWARINSPDVTPREWELAQTELIKLGAESVPVLVQALQSG